jgi:copper transport protein
MWRVWGAVLLGVVGGVFLWASPALGHAVLLRTSPPSGVALDAPPDRLVLTFTEPVHPALSTAELLDASGRAQPLRTELDAQGRTLTTFLPRLGAGTYAVRWRVLSQVDGHLTTGLVTFGIGVRPKPAAASAERPPLSRLLLRWVLYAATVLLAGSVAFERLTVPASTELPVSCQKALQIQRAVASLALLIAAVAEFGFLVDGALTQVRRLGAFLATPAGIALGLRLGAALAFLGPEASRRWWALPAAALVLLGSTVNAHAWGAGWVVAAADWVHLAAASVWVGGLGSLGTVLVASGRAWRAVVPLAPRFSWWAGWSLGALVLSGAALSLAEASSVLDLLQTEWGKWLSLKLALAVLLVALGAVNRYTLVPRLATGRPSEDAFRRFVRLIRAEVVLGAAVLLVVGILTITPTARTVRLAAAPEPTLRLVAFADGLRVGLSVRPLEPGWNRFELSVQDKTGAPVPVDRVMVRLWKLDEDVLPARLRLVKEGAGRYGKEGGELGVAGFWAAEVVLRWRGRLDVQVFWPLPVGQIQLRSDLEAFRMLRRAREAMERLRTWREQELLADGAGNAVLTRYAFRRPDRVRFEVRGGMRGVLVGRNRYVQTDSGWRREVLPTAFVARGVSGYMLNPIQAQLGRRMPCGEESCRVVLWKSSDGLATFAAWVGERTYRTYRLLMAAPGHYMASVVSDFDLPFDVAPPADR